MAGTALVPNDKAFGRPLANVFAQCQKCHFVESFDYQDALLMVVVGGKAYVRSDAANSTLREIHNPKNCGGKFRFFQDLAQFSVVT